MISTKTAVWIEKITAEIRRLGQERHIEVAPVHDKPAWIVWENIHTKLLVLRNPQKVYHALATLSVGAGIDTLCAAIAPCVIVESARDDLVQWQKNVGYIVADL